ncbi:MAG: hypothetical protein R2716_05430 [Microthrixaceae bacterium]
MHPKEVTASFWPALYAHDWELVASFFDDESIYFDVPTGPATAAKGPADIVARLRLGLDTVSDTTTAPHRGRVRTPGRHDRAHRDLALAHRGECHAAVRLGAARPRRQDPDLEGLLGLPHTPGRRSR